MEINADPPIERLLALLRPTEIWYRLRRRFWNASGGYDEASQTADLEDSVCVELQCARPEMGWECFLVVHPVRCLLEHLHKLYRSISVPSLREIFPDMYSNVPQTLMIPGRFIIAPTSAQFCSEVALFGRHFVR